MSNVKELLKEKLTAESYDRLMAVDNTKIHEFIADAIELSAKLLRRSPLSAQVPKIAATTAFAVG